MRYPGNFLESSCLLKKVKTISNLFDLKACVSVCTVVNRSIFCFREFLCEISYVYFFERGLCDIETVHLLIKVSKGSTLVRGAKA